MIGRLNHVAIAVPQLGPAVAQYRGTLGAQVSDPELGTHAPVKAGAIRATVVGHEPLHLHTACGEPGDRAAEEPNAGHRPFVFEDFDVRDAAGVVDRDMTELPAHSVVAVVAPTRHAMPRNPELAEFLDIDMDEFARVAPAVTVRRLWWLKARPSLQPQPSQHRAHRRGRHDELGGDLGAGPAQSS